MTLLLLLLLLVVVVVVVLSLPISPPPPSWCRMPHSTQQLPVQYSTVQYTPTGADTGVLMTAISPAVLPIDPSIDMTGCGGSLPALHAVNWMPSWSTSIDHH
jgi:hypothetical protein